MKMKIQDLIGKTIAAIEVGKRGEINNEQSDFDAISDYAKTGVIVFTDGTRVELEVSDPGCVWIKKPQE